MWLRLSVHILSLGLGHASLPATHQSSLRLCLLNIVGLAPELLRKIRWLGRYVINFELLGRWLHLRLFLCCESRLHLLLGWHLVLLRIVASLHDVLGDVALLSLLVRDPLSHDQIFDGTLLVFLSEALGPFLNFLSGRLGWRIGRRDTQLLIDKLALFLEPRHAFAQVEVLKVGAGVRTNKFLLLLTFVDALVICQVNVIDVRVHIFLHI